MGKLVAISAIVLAAVSSAAQYADLDPRIRWSHDVSIAGTGGVDGSYAHVYVDPSDAMAVGETYSAIMGPAAGFHAGNSGSSAVYSVSDVAKGTPSTFSTPVPYHLNQYRTSRTYILLSVRTPSADEEDVTVTQYLLPVTITTRGGT